MYFIVPLTFAYNALAKWIPYKLHDLDTTYLLPSRFVIFGNNKNIGQNTRGTEARYESLDTRRGKQHCTSVYWCFYGTILIIALKIYYWVLYGHHTATELKFIKLKNVTFTSVYLFYLLETLKQTLIHSQDEWGAIKDSLAEIGSIKRLQTSKGYPTDRWFSRRFQINRA